MTQRGGFDGRGHLTINSRPRFVLGVYDSGGGYSTDPSFWGHGIFDPSGDRGLADVPINVYLNYFLGGMPIDATRALLDALQRHGVAYLQTGNAFAAGSWRRMWFSIADEPYVRAFAEHPAALGYYVADEIVGALIAETEEHNQQLHALDPSGVTFSALMAGVPEGEADVMDPAKYARSADVLGVDPYPLYGREPAAGYPHFVVADYVSKVRRAARPDRPVWAVLQFFRGTSDARLPTADEMRAHAIMAIVEGAQGIMWWDIGVNGIRHENEQTVAEYMGHLRELVTELSRLEPALVGDSYDWALTHNSTRFPDPIAGRLEQLQHNIDVEWLYSRKRWYQAEIAALKAGDWSRSGGMLDQAANVRTRVFAMGDAGYIFAYNYTNQRQPVTFSSTHFVLSSVVESKTGRPFPMTRTSFSDTLGPYEGRIYVVRGRAEESAPGPIVVTPDPVVTPPIVTPPAPTATFTASILHPASGAMVNGEVGVGGSTTAPWARAKTFSLFVDKRDPVTGEIVMTKVLEQSVPSGSTWWPRPGWNTRAIENGPHMLRLDVTVEGQTATMSQPVVVNN